MRTMDFCSEQNLRSKTPRDSTSELNQSQSSDYSPPVRGLIPSPERSQKITEELFFVELSENYAGEHISGMHGQAGEKSGSTDYQGRCVRRA